MHDPLTVAFEIKYPWWRDKPWPKKHRHGIHTKFAWKHRMTDKEREPCDQMWPEGYRNTFITIWHKDPERGGSDDSCGFGYVNPTEQQKERLNNIAWGEGRNPHFLCCNAKEWEGTFTEAVSLYTGLVLLTARGLGLEMTADAATKWAIQAIHHADCVPATRVFCFVPGYHTNFEEDTSERRQEHFFGILCGVARGLLTERRPWWKHPRWHFWHWRLQIHPWQSFKRAFIERCSKCGKGFKWGESVVGDWSGKRIWHDHCDESGVLPTSSPQSPPPGAPSAPC